jgi:hypothetical protein
MCFDRVIIAFPRCHAGVAFGDAQCMRAQLIFIANSTDDWRPVVVRARGPGALSGDVERLSWGIVRQRANANSSARESKSPRAPVVANPSRTKFASMISRISCRTV